MTARAGLDPLLAPESVAVVGASPDSWYSSQLIDNLLEYGFDGELYPVNPGREEAWGRTCYDRVSALPEVVDLAVVSVPREYVVDTVTDAGGMGVPAALVITAGFGEADERGERLERELAETAAEHGIRVGGPNCIGLANALEGIVLTSTCSRSPSPGSIGLVSQSGALAFTTFFERAADESIDFAYVVSTGNEADLTLTDHVEYMAGDPEVSVICAYIEGLDDPRRFMDAAREAERNGTPVLAVKVGRTEDAAAATLSHTGSLTGSDAAWGAAFDQTGVERVPDVPDLIGRASAHAAFDPPESDRVCIASTSGGLASLLADLASERDLTLPDVDGETERALLDMEPLLTFGEVHNPADIRGYGAEILPEIAEVLFRDEAFDAYVFAIGLPAVDERAAGIADDLLAVAETADAPVFYLWTGRKEPADLPDPQPYERVREELPLYYDPARCMDAVASVVEAGATTDDDASRRWAAVGEDPSEGSGVELPSGRTLAWREAERLLDAYDIETPRTRVADSADEAARFAADLGYPVVLKVDSTDIPHRTDADAVRLDLGDERAVREAYRTIVENCRAYDPAADINGVLIQPRVEEGVEALVGISSGDAFGPTVTVGSGGTMTELLDDAVVRVPPLSRSEVREAVGRTKLEPLLAGHRGDAPGDTDALVSLVERVSRMAVEEDAIEEMDLNPVVVHERDAGVSVVDVLVRTR